MKSVYLLTLMIVCNVFLNAQSLCNENINSSGNFFKQDSGITNIWSIGSPIVGKMSSADNTLLIYNGFVPIPCDCSNNDCSKSNCFIDDWTALKALYDSTNGDNWLNKDGWDQFTANEPLPDCNLGALYGVTINEFGRVDSLTLINNQLSGTIPPELCNLTELVYLNLDDNDLTGEIPQEICTLENLTVLGLSGGDLSGEIPENFLNFTDLIELDLSENDLENEIPEQLYELTNLNILNLSNNHFEGLLSPDIQNLNSLVIFDASNNELSGSIPLEIGTLSNLEELDLSYNAFSDNIPPEIGGLENLLSLNLSTNLLTNEIPPELGDLDSLQYLNLWNNSLTGEIPEELGNNTEMSIVILAHNQLEGPIPDSLATIENLEYLDVSHNRLSGIIPPFDEEVTEKIVVNNNYFSCADFELYFYINEPKLDALFHEQSIDIHPTGFEDVYTYLDYEGELMLTFNTPYDYNNNTTYQWIRNGEYIEGNNQNSLEIGLVDSTNVGRYRLKITQEGCLLNGDKSISYITDPVYVALYNYDLQGNFIEYYEFIKEFENNAAKIKFDDEVKDVYNGTLAGNCNCNRELYLYEFPDTNFMRVMLTLEDRDIVKLPTNTSPLTDTNYRLNDIDSETTSIQSYEVSIDDGLTNFTDSIDIALIDAGLDQTNFEEADNFLYDCAPIDDCYQGICAPGYNFVHPYGVGEVDTITINNNYSNSIISHGTQGFRLISSRLHEIPNAKIIPLKIFEDDPNEGRLFDLICALYHAIDQNADVINISTGYEGEPSDILENAITLAKRNEIFIVTAAGNKASNMDVGNNDITYPAFYSNKKHLIYSLENVRTNPGSSQREIVDTIQFNHLISVAAVDVNGDLYFLSNRGSESVSIAAPGVAIQVQGLAGIPEVTRGTSIAAFLTSQALAREIAHNKDRTLAEIWRDFESNLESNDKLADVTRTGKQIKFNWKEVENTTVEPCQNGADCSTDCDDIFEKYSWLRDKVTCGEDEITVYYYSDSWEFIDVQSEESRILYLSDGTPNCYNNQVESCIEFYSLTQILDECICTDSTSNLCEDTTACNFGEPLPCENGNSTCKDTCNCIYGCTDPDASNYNDNADLDDGSCHFIDPIPDPENSTTLTTLFYDFPWLSTLVNQNDCTNESIIRYDAGSYSFILIMKGDEGELYYQDGTFYCNQTPSYSCVEAYGLTNINRNWSCGENSIATDPVSGCTDTSALNFNVLATVDDGSCAHDPISGCTDSSATNYNSSATVDDGLCEYDPILGCTDSSATNYNSSATVDNGSCEYPPACNCNCYTGTFFYEDCGEENYYFIRLEDGRILDPYFDEDFYPVEGQQIYFDYEINDSITTPCSIAENPVNITCFQNSVDIFVQYPWLNNHIDQSNCLGERINVYAYPNANFKFITITNSTNTTLFYQDGTFYCTDCIKLYNLSEVIESWQCDNSPVGKPREQRKRLSDQKANFNIYPNPANQKVYLELSSNHGNVNHLTLYDLTGEVLYRHQFKDVYTMVDLENFARGMYIVEVNNEEGQHIQKLIIE